MLAPGLVTLVRVAGHFGLTCPAGVLVGSVGIGLT